MVGKVRVGCEPKLVARVDVGRCTEEQGPGFQLDMHKILLYY